MRVFRTAVLPLLVVQLLIAPQLYAASSPWLDQEQAQLRLVLGENSQQLEQSNNPQVLLGLEMALSGNWHSYWKTPGDAGLPPEFSVLNSSISLDQPLWPAPQRFDSLGIETLGYHGNVVFLFPLVDFDPAQDGHLDLEVTYLVCDTLCLPKSAQLSLSWQGNLWQEAAHDAVISAAYQKIPQTSAQAGYVFLDQDKGLVTNAQNSLLAFALRAEQPFEAVDIFVESSQEGWNFTGPQLSFSQDKKLVWVEIGASKAWDFPQNLEQTLALTMVDGDKAVVFGALKAQELADIAAYKAEIFQAKSAQSHASKAPLQISSRVLLMLWVAFVGGLILNVMPCVLPVLSLKLLATLQSAQDDRRQLRLSFFATALGIISSFWLLAFFTVLLKLSGQSLGWGMQFQQPWFVLIMMGIMGLFSANLFGLFELHLPARLTQVLDRFTVAKADPTQRQKLIHSFFMGFLATLLATPCSAPFLGTALSFALSQSSLLIVLIFTCLGLGLATPYLLLMAAPQALGFLPKPGPWMLIVRKAMGLALLLTLLWLASVLDAQSGSVMVIIAFILLIAAIGFFAKQRAMALISLGLFLSLPLWPLAQHSWLFGWLNKEPSNSAQAELALRSWHDWDIQEIAQRSQKGQLSLLDITARWCITCQTNKSLVIDRQPAQALFARQDVKLFRADWTSPDQEISDFLAEHQRYGIPFTIVYGPKAPKGIILPELLNHKALVQAIEDAR